jgi:hypothetical protein
MKRSSLEPQILLMEIRKYDHELHRCTGNKMESIGRGEKRKEKKI